MFLDRPKAVVPINGGHQLGGRSLVSDFPSSLCSMRSRSRSASRLARSMVTSRCGGGWGRVARQRAPLAESSSARTADQRAREAASSTSTCNPSGSKSWPMRQAGFVPVSSTGPAQMGHAIVLMSHHGHSSRPTASAASIGCRTLYLRPTALTVSMVGFSGAAAS